MGPGAGGIEVKRPATAGRGGAFSPTQPAAAAQFRMAARQMPPYGSGRILGAVW